MDLNNRRKGKDATKPRALGLLGNSVNSQESNIASVKFSTFYLILKPEFNIRKIKVSFYRL